MQTLMLVGLCASCGSPDHFQLEGFDSSVWWEINFTQSGESMHLFVASHEDGLCEDLQSTAPALEQYGQNVADGDRSCASFEAYVDAMEVALSRHFAEGQWVLGFTYSEQFHSGLLPPNGQLVVAADEAQSLRIRLQEHLVDYFPRYREGIGTGVLRDSSGTTFCSGQAELEPDELRNFSGPVETANVTFELDGDTIEIEIDTQLMRYPLWDEEPDEEIHRLAGSLKATRCSIDLDLVGRDNMSMMPFSPFL